MYLLKKRLKLKCQSKILFFYFINMAEVLDPSVEAWKQAEQSIEKHKDLVSDNVIDIIATREAENARREYNVAKLSWRANDNFCREPGIRIYTTTTWKEWILEICRKWGYPISSDSIAKINEDTWEINLKNWMYSMWLWWCQLYRDFSTEWDSYRGQHPFATSYDDIKRIEWYHGALWQNVNYDENHKNKRK